MCCCLGCCPNTKPITMGIVLLVFFFLTFLLSIILSCFMASSTNQYKESLENLQGTIDKSILNKFPISCFKDKYDYSNSPCEKDGAKYKKQEYLIFYSGLFKNLKKIELSFNIILIIITFFYTLCLVFILYEYFFKKMNDSNNESKENKILKTYFKIMIIVSDILVPFSIVSLILRTLAYIAFSDIGLYKIDSNDSNKFLNCQVINIAIHLIIIPFLIVCLVFSILFRDAYNRDISLQQTNIPYSVQNNNDHPNTEQNLENHETSPQKISRRTSPTGREVKIVQSEELRIQSNPKVKGES